MDTSSLAHHVIMRLCDDRVLAPDVAAMRDTARVVLARGSGRGLLAFRVADTHLHAVVACGRESAGRFAHAVESALRQRRKLPVGFERARCRPVRDQRHLTNAVVYVLRQLDRHRLDIDPLHDGSSLADLLGLRVVEPGLSALLKQLVPRIRREECLEMIGWGELDDASPAWDDLADAAAGAFGLPALEGMSASAVLARRAGAHAACGAGVSTSRVSELLGLTRRAITYALREESSPEAVRAVTLQAQARSLLAARSARCASQRLP